MILWTLKLLKTVRRAIAGRRYPHQMAAAVAFGTLLGIVPHGNLLAVMLLILVVSLKLNHALAALTAIATSFLATHLDAYSHEVGQYVLSDPRLAETRAQLWTLPLMPWTDLNNTVVLGSFLIGTAALLPLFTLTYPIFRALAPRKLSEPALTPTESDADGDTVDAAHQVLIVQPAHHGAPAPHASEQTNHTDAALQDRVEVIELGDRQLRVDAGLPTDTIAPTSDQIAVETRIDVIRMTDSDESAPARPAAAPQPAAEPMDEALNYLLRQLRDSQQRKAA